MSLFTSNIVNEFETVVLLNATVSLMQSFFRKNICEDLPACGSTHWEGREGSQPQPNSLVFVPICPHKSGWIPFLTHSLGRNF